MKLWTLSLAIAGSALLGTTAHADQCQWVDRGQAIKAYIVLRPGHEPHEATVKALQEWVKAQIAPYKYPRRVEFVEALPRTETGKLQRYRLREHGEER